MVLPQHLIAWLVEKGMWPGKDISHEELSKFWENAKNHGQAWAKNVPSSTHPLYIWGDDAQYDEKGSKLVIIVLGHCLDEQSDSTLSCFPLACIRYEPGLHVNPKLSHTNI